MIDRVGVAKVVALLALALGLAGCTFLPAPLQPTPATAPETPEPLSPEPSPPCALLDLDVSRERVPLGEDVTIRVSLQNCGLAPLPYSEPVLCPEAPALTLALVSHGGTYHLPEDLRHGAPQEGSWRGGGCRAQERPAFVLLDGEAWSLERAWNGTVRAYACEVDQTAQGTSERCSLEERQLAPGHVRVELTYEMQDDSGAMRTWRVSRLIEWVAP